MTTINAFGQTVDSTWTPPAIATERRLYHGGNYKGMLTHYRGVGWTHSLLRHGSEPFSTAELAERDFWQTKAQLPANVHRAIFGHAS